MRKPMIQFCILILFFCTFVSFSARGETQSPNEKEWTMLVYLNGNNNLDSYGTLNLKQMEKIGSSQNINIVVQWASLENKKTQRLFITKSTDPHKVTSPVLQNLGNVDMGDWKNLSEFIQWGATHFPAKHYFVDVWDHGGGWHIMNFLRNYNQSRYHSFDISWDDNSGNFISTEQLGLALADSAQFIGHKIDLFASDACLMAMAEVADQVADSVYIYAGSEEVEPGTGWPYDTFLAQWAQHPQSTPVDVAKLLTKEYIQSYNGGENGIASATFSAFNLSKINLLYASVSKLGETIVNLPITAKSKLLNAANSTQTFAYSDYKDLLDFLSVADSAQIQGLDQNTLKEIRSILSEFIVANETTSDYNKALGLSIWLPTTSSSFSSYSERYQGLKFQAHTQWGDVLHFLLD